MKKLLLLVGFTLVMTSKLHAEKTVAVNASAFSGMKVYPNPFRADQHQSIFFSPVPDGATVEIFTLAGQHVVSLEPSNNEVVWNASNSHGESVASGIYLYLVKDGKGNKSTGKLAIIK